MDRVEAEAIYDAGREACVEFILELAARVERFEDRLRRLEEQTRQDSRTSSKPPSQDPPKTRQQRRAEARVKAKESLAKDGAQRKAGGQDGHRGAGRKLAPEDQVDEIVDHYPDACRGCGRELGEDERRRGGRFGRHQVAELPPISVIVVEHRTQRLRCPECKTKTVAELPFGVGESAFGPRLQAAIVTLTARHRISRRGASELASRVVRDRALDRRGRRDLPARQRRARRPAHQLAGLGARPARGARRRDRLADRRRFARAVGRDQPRARRSSRSPSTATASSSTS